MTRTLTRTSSASVFVGLALASVAAAGLPERQYIPQTPWRSEGAWIRGCGFCSAALAAPPAKAPRPIPALLSVELLGEDAHRVAALARVAAGLEIAELGSISRTQIDGEIVGRVPNLREALAWVGTHAFGASLPQQVDLLALTQGDAPRPGGDLYQLENLALMSLIVTPLSADGNSVAREWPRNWAEGLPSDLHWSLGHAVGLRTPIFAAPSSEIPAAAERFATLNSDAEVLLVDVVDRCTTQPRQQCLRWHQVVAREKNRFHAGYVLGGAVVRDENWKLLSEGGPAANLTPVAHFGDAAVFLLLVDFHEGRPSRRLLRFPAGPDRYPQLAVAVVGDRIEVRRVGGDSSSAVTLPLRPDFAPMLSDPVSNP